MATLELFTREEAAKNLRISLPSLDRLVKTGALKGVNIGRRRLFRPGDLSSYLDSRRDGTPGFSAEVRGLIVREFLAWYEAVETLNKAADSHKAQLSANGVDVQFLRLNPYGLRSMSPSIAKETKSNVLLDLTAWAASVASGDWQAATSYEADLRRSGVQVAFVGAGQQS